MNWDQIKGKWQETKGQAQQKWGKLTDDDLDVIDGKARRVGWKNSAAIRYCQRRSRKTSEGI